METTIFIICLAIGAALTVVRYLYELQMMQQNSYRNERYLKWLFGKTNPERARVEYALGLSSVALAYFAESNAIVASSAIIAYSAISIISLTVIFKTIKRKQKKKLVFTPRAQRLFFTTLAIVVAVTVVLSLVVNRDLDKINSYLIFSISALALVISPLIITIANIVTAPVERKINQWYYNDAKRKLAQMPNLKIIGITGSYGKTSTKHFLYRVLTEKYNVLMTPGSYNTTMGVIRTIREQLKPTHEVFIVEMGAKQLGDIREICDLVNPEIGVLTAVGPQHLETFKTIEGVQRTKFELIDALPSNGLAVLNADYDKIADREVKNVTTKYYSSEDSKVQYSLKDIAYTKLGSKFSAVTSGKEIGLFETKLLGSYNLSNILSAIIVAEHLDIPTAKIAYAIKRIESVQHRLEVKRLPNGVTIIDDAFNANPIGSKMALEVLGSIEGDRKIIITPGMIELGSEQARYNELFGEAIAEVSDYTILVGKKITAPIQKGLRSANYPTEKLFIASNFKEALAHVNSIVKRGDVLLYENDLPDTYEQ